MASNERPGVYSSYEVTSSLTGKSTGGIVGVAAAAATGTAGTVYIINSYAAACEKFGADSNMAGLVRILILNGAGSVRCVPVEGTDYAAAFAALQTDADVKIVVCDSRDATVHTVMKQAIMNAGEASRYRVGIVEAEGETAELVAKAATLNCERIALAAPVAPSGIAGSMAAAVAGQVAASTDPALPFNGAVLYAIDGIDSNFEDGDITTLIQGGVTPVEMVGGDVSIVRAVTTRTKTGTVSDATWRELTTTLIIDDVIPTVRAALRSRFSRSKNTAQTRGAIRTQVVIELESKLSREIIDSYDNVTAVADDSDPTVCAVSFDFTVAHGLNIINLTAHITV